MKNRVVVNIGDIEYTIVADESEGYIRDIAELVGNKIDEIAKATRCPRLTAATLAAVNFADEMEKARRSTENMRAELKTYLDDSGKMRSELNEARREITRLRYELENAQKGNGR